MSSVTRDPTSSRRGLRPPRPPHAPRLIPAGKRTTNRGKCLTWFRCGAGPYSCGHSAGFPPASFSTGGRDRRTLVLPPRYGLGAMLVNPGTL